MSHNDSGEIVACRVEKGDENRVASRLVNLFVTTDSSSVSLAGYTHSEQSFPFSPQHASFFPIILFHFSQLLYFSSIVMSFFVCP